MGGPGEANIIASQYNQLSPIFVEWPDGSHSYNWMCMSWVTPMTTRQSALRISRIEFVEAAIPNVFANPSVNPRVEASPLWEI